MRLIAILGVVAVIAVGVTTEAVFSHQRQVEVKKIKEKMADLAFCQKGYEIASSFPALTALYEHNHDRRDALLEKSEILALKGQAIGQILETEVKQEALVAGIGEQEFDQLFSEILPKAELEAVMVTEKLGDPEALVKHLSDTCSRFIE